MIAKKIKLIPLEIVLRNIAYGSLCKQTTIKPGTFLSKPLIDIYLNNDELNDPLITKDRIELMNIISSKDLDLIVIGPEIPLANGLADFLRQKDFKVFGPNKYELIYEGKAKKVFTHDDVEKVRIEFKDDATAFNALKKEKFEGKVKLNCLISAKIFEILIKKNIPTHFIILEN